MLNAIQWVGKGNKDINDVNIFIQYMIALETLTSGKEDTIRVISERVAFIVSTDKESRIETYNLVKELYDKRSKIIHGSSENIDIKDIKDLQDIVNKVIKNLLTKEEFKDFETISDLNNWINEQKYIVCTDPSHELNS